MDGPTPGRGRAALNQLHQAAGTLGLIFFGLSMTQALAAGMALLIYGNYR